MKAAVIVFGNCVTYFVRDALLQLLPHHEYDIIHMLDHPDPMRRAAVKIDDETLKRCVFLVDQRTRWRRFPYLERLPPSCQRISLPVLAFQTFWPLEAEDARNTPAPPEFPYGKYPYGDRLVLRLRGKGVKTEDIWKEYRQTDLNTIVDLDRLHPLVMNRVSAMDSECDIQVGPFIEKHFLDVRLFWASDHPTRFLAAPLVDRAISALGVPCPPGKTAQLVSDIFDNFHQPIHPQVIEHFGLTVVDPTTRYHYHDDTWLTFEEYMQRYILWK